MAFKTRDDLKYAPLRKQIVKLRNQENPWGIICQKIEEEFGSKMTKPTCQRIFEQEIALTTVSSPKARDQAKSDYSMVHDRYQRACDMIDDLCIAIEKMKPKLDEEDYLKKYAPIIITLSREIINQLEYLKKEQERITINQKNLIWSPIQINVQVNKQLKELETQGFIRILKKIPTAKSEKEEKEEEMQNES